MKAIAAHPGKADSLRLREIADPNLHDSERGISLLHGYLTEYDVENRRSVVPLPPNPSEVTVAEKEIDQPFQIQRLGKGTGA